MKKTLLTAALALGTLFSFSQRTIDWSVETILNPTELNSTETAGTTFNYTIVCKNNSTTDTILATDTFGIQILGVAGSTNIFAIPSPTTIALRVLGRDVKPGDTIHITGGYNVGLRVNQSANINFIVSSEVINRAPGAAGLNRETTATIGNNTKSKTLTWYNFQKWGVGLNNVSSTIFSVYPNPANGQLFINSNVVAFNETALVQMFDLSGKIVLSENIQNFAGNSAINIANLAKGIYFLQLTNGNQNFTSKVIVD